MTAITRDPPHAPRDTMTPREPAAAGEIEPGPAGTEDTVRDLLLRAQRGAGGVVLAEGEPGIGKSRLLRDSAVQAAGLGFGVVAGAADELGQAIPFFALGTAVGQPFAGPATGPGHGGPDATAWWIIEVQAQLERRAADAPVLVCLDDLNWAGPATLAALRALPRALRQQPVAWLLARSASPRRAAGRLFGLLAEEGAARVGLLPLGADAMVAMVTEAFGAPPGPALADLARGAAGNPALLAELIGGLRDEHAVRVSAGRAGLGSPRLPGRVHRLAQRRLDGLSRQARQLLMTAAVLGTAFRLEDAAEMLGQTPAALLPAVEETMDAAIMTAAGRTFAFRHQLLRRAVGELIPQPARLALHGQYGELLLARGEAADRAAGHLLQAADPADRASLAGLDRAAAQTRCSAPQAAAGLAVRAHQLTAP
ncbi:MAG TPA: AAA family ATPase, partial [Streptosporangiaceae bacterium]